MTGSVKQILEQGPVETSAPCRVDMGGTLDISTLHYPMRHLQPCTFNIAVDLRTRIRLTPYRNGWVKVTSRGFSPAAFPLDHLPFDHPLGLLFAVAAYYRASGVHISVDSASPPRSAMGGSSSAAVALVGAFSKARARAGSKSVSRRATAMLARSLEASVAAVPCGLQDQLAAAYGGVNAWYWQADIGKSRYRRRVVVRKSGHGSLARHLLFAYCGFPHESKDINGIWIRQFLSGNHRRSWEQILQLTRDFVDAMCRRQIRKAVSFMNRETAVRMEMTPQVLDSVGVELVRAAVARRCGARFTGAGGGGCVWAIGEIDEIENLKLRWQDILARRKQAFILEAGIDSKGLMVDDEDIGCGME